MRKTPACIALVGLIFVFFTLPLFGVDLLIDAVGWLVVYNGVRVFRKLVPAFGPVNWFCLALVAVCALQLFLTAGAAALVLWYLRKALETAFFVFLARGAAKWPERGDAAAGMAASWLSLASWLKAGVGLCLMLLVTIMGVGFSAVSAVIAEWTPAIDAGLNVLNLAYLGVLAWFAFAPPPKNPAP